MPAGYRRDAGWGPMYSGCSGMLDKDFISLQYSSCYFNLHCGLGLNRRRSIIASLEAISPFRRLE
jgi:hypothetical protein